MRPAATGCDFVYFGNVNGQQKYFLAWIPPAPLAAQAQAEKEALAARCGARASLRSPPHITLHMPFLWKSQKEDKLIAALARFAVRESAVPVLFDGYGCFPPRVIFWQAVATGAVMDFHYRLQRFCRTELQLFHAAYRDLPFHPHLTLVFRDLKKAVFEEVWPALARRPLQAAFVADRFALLRCDERQWRVIHEWEAAAPANNSYNVAVS
jgi:2'-5' RNA ligase